MESHRLRQSNFSSNLLTGWSMKESKQGLVAAHKWTSAPSRAFFFCVPVIAVLGACWVFESQWVVFLSFNSKWIALCLISSVAVHMCEQEVTASSNHYGRITLRLIRDSTARMRGSANVSQIWALGSGSLCNWQSRQLSLVVWHETFKLHYTENKKSIRHDCFITSR